MITAVSVTPANAVARPQGDHLNAASTAPSQTGKTITSSDIGAVRGAAADQWPGWDVSGASVVVGDLSGNTLALTSGNTITVDPDAAGWGWSVSGSPAPGTMDLFTALAHEYGHIAGFEHSSGLMASTLGDGERRYNSDGRKYPPEPAPEPDPAPAPAAKTAAATTADPAPADPAPADPAPADPAPADPTPADPAPEAPAPADVAPVDPAPSASDANPAPVTTAEAVTPAATSQEETTPSSPAATTTTTDPSPVWTIQMTGTSGRLVFNADGTATFGSETRTLAGLTTISVTGTSGDDTFTVDRGTSNPAIRVIFDGAAGFDTLATAGDTSSATSLAADQHSGVLYLDATVIENLNIEPIANSGTTADAIYDLGGSDNGDAVLALDGSGKLTLSGDGFEEVHFNAPSTSLTIRGGGGIDQLTVMGAIALGIANLIIQMERIILADNAAITTTGNVSLEAASDVNGGPMLGCVMALATHCAEAAVDVNGGDISAGSVNLSATATVVPDATHATAYGIVVDSKARVSVTGNANIHGTGAVGLSATSTVGPVTLVKDYGDVAVITSEATVTLGGSAVITGGDDVTMSSTSTVTAGATPGSAGKTEGANDSAGDSSFDAAVALVTVTATTIPKVTDTARLAVSGDLGLSATNAATLTATGDATGATSGAGIAIVNLDQTTESFIDSSNPTATTVGGKLAVTADSDATLAATSKASPGGSTQNDKPANDSSRGKDQAKTAEGNIGIVGALSVNVVNGATRAHLSGAKVATGQSQTIHAGSKNTVTATADGSATSSGAVGVGVAVALNLVDLVTEAFLDGGAVLGGTGVVVEAFGPAADKNAFTATATSGAGGSSNVGVAGSLALNLITTRTLATGPGQTWVAPT